MKQGSTLFLKSVIWLIGLVAFAVCTLVLPRALGAEIADDFDYGPIIIGMLVAAVPFFIALHQALKLLGFIDTNKVFSESAVAALKKIKYCAYAISGVFAVLMPNIFYLADLEDAPGLAAIGFIIIGASFVFATAIAVLQRLVQHAVDIKSENDLTV